MSIKVYENFLEKDRFDNLKKEMLSNSVPWFFNNSKVRPGENEFDFENYQLSHTFYSNCFPQSQYIEIINPLMEKINPRAVVKIKANLNFKTNEPYVYGYHSDVDFICNTAVFYINNNNGKTLFEDGSFVDSVENRLCVFDSNLKHSAVSTTDKKYRCVININYF